MHNDHSKTSDPAVGSTRLVGRPWKVVVNGRTTLNARRYGATFTGRVERVDGDRSIYDILRALADYLEQQNAEMEYPDSFQVTFPPPNVPAQRPPAKDL